MNLEQPSSDQPDDLREIARKLLRAADLLDLPMVRETYLAEDLLVALRPNSGGMIISVPYYGGPFDPTTCKVVKGGWNHDHCSMCAARVLPGDDWWTAALPDEVGLCLDCHDLMIRSSDALGSAGLVPDRSKPRLARERFMPMTEAEWVASKSPRAMLMSLKDREEARTIDRKLRLFASACVRRAWHVLSDARSRRMVEVAERYADGLATPEELEAAEDEATAATSDLFRSGGLRASYDPALEGFEEGKLPAGTVIGEQPEARAWKAACAADSLARRKVGRAGTSEWYEGGAWIAAVLSSRTVDEALADPVVLREREASEKAAEEALWAPLLATEPIAAALEIRSREDADAVASDLRRLYGNPGQADLLRCIFGNPFRHFTIHPSWLTEDAVSMARSMVKDRSFDRLTELADLLEAAGCRDLVLLKHCREPGEHWRGCWVIDVILGKP